ncbi:hypothetical protein CK203_065833 [Vitis vinifera]|uniref:Uncharacterized protein n=1 Tax=Vitis vinifera TaxID=29760 RepID=A0A438G4M9_VITVI|nr:hypothetical protein CK203_065833 [Vitis vinifera]
MATLRLPDVAPSSTQDSERLRVALQGFYPSSFSSFISLHLLRVGSGSGSDNMDIGTQKCSPKEEDQRDLSTAF